MKKLTLFLVGICTLFFSAGAQHSDTLTQPQEKIIVNKEFDEEGNLITYDSTYINSWSNDTSFQFNDFFFKGEDFIGIDEFLNDFFSDSLRQNFGFTDEFGSSFFNDEFFRNFSPAFPDSMFSQNFPFSNDSAFHFRHEFSFPDLEEMQKQMQKHFQEFNLYDPENDKKLSEEQRKELKALQEKHKKEMDNLMQKWENRK